MSRVTRKTDICLCENKGADQLRSNCEADQRFCFHYRDSTFPLLIFRNYKLLAFFLGLYRLVCLGPGRNSRKTSFLASQLICIKVNFIEIISSAILLPCVFGSSASGGGGGILASGTAGVSSNRLPAPSNSSPAIKS